ncbi:MAG: CheR family methyltransferase [Acidobacteriaceae bacterium]
MVLNKIEKLDDYANYLRKQPGEVEELFADLLINVTRFFRDPGAYDALSKRVLPLIVKGREPDAPIRIWAPGCSTGEEAYSLAIVVFEYPEKTGKKIPVQIFGTDISEASLEKARKGIYPESISEDVSKERLRRFFVRVDDGYRISKPIRDVCVFSRHNLFNDPPFSRIDLVSCRNMLIYLGAALQKKVVPMLHYALQPNGFLFLGSSEGVSGSDHLFSPVDKKSRIFVQKPAANRHLDFSRNVLSSQIAHAKTRAGGESTESESAALEKEIDRVVLFNYAPSGVVIGSNMNVLSFRGRTNRYLEPAPGKASLNLLRMAKAGLGRPLQTTINEAKKTGQTVRTEHIPVQFNGKTGLVNIEVTPMRAVLPNESCFLVVFQSAASGGPKPEPVLPGSRRKAKPAENGEIARLKLELEDSQEALRTVMEAHEAGEEELRAANEEVLSANEELQSTNEELETSKEELQSTNEELATLNDELRNRNHDLGELNSDLVNLLGSIDIPILMIGNDLRIRRLTPSADRVFNVLASDVGRPITDIRPKIEIPDLEEMILGVVESLTPATREVQDAHGCWYSLEIRPYRTIENKIDGAVLSLIDIDLQKHRAEMQERSREFSDSIVDTVRQPLLILDHNLRIVRANEAFYETFQANPAAAERNFRHQWGNEEWNVPELQALLDKIFPAGAITETRNLDVEHAFPDIGHRVMRLNARRVHEISNGDEPMILLSIEDITERKQAEEAVRAHMEELDRSNRAMVGRELRMIELKKEVNEIRRQQGEPASYPLEFEPDGEKSPQPG